MCAFAGFRRLECGVASFGDGRSKFYNHYFYVRALLDLVAYRVVFYCQVVFWNLAVKLLRKTLFRYIVKGSPFVRFYVVTFAWALCFIALFLTARPSSSSRS